MAVVGELTVRALADVSNLSQNMARATASVNSLGVAAAAVAAPVAALTASVNRAGDTTGRARDAMGRFVKATADLGVEAGRVDGALATLRQGFDGLLRAANRYSDAAERAQRKTRGLQDAGNALSSAGGGLSLGLTLPILAGGAFAASSAASLDSLTKGLEAVTGSAREAEAQLVRLREIGKLPSVEFEGAVRASIAFQAIGKSAAFAERAIRGVANGVTLSGGGQQQFEGVLIQMRQLASLGKAGGEEVRAILEAAPALSAAFQTAFGTTSAEAIRKMGLTSDQFFERLFKGMESLPQVAGGAQSSFENFTASVRDAAAALGEKLLPAIVPVLNGAAGLLNQVRELDPNTVRWGLALAGVAVVVGPLIGLVGTLTTAVASLVAVGASLAVVVGIGAPLLLGIAALGALFLKTGLDAAAAAAQVEAAAARMKAAISGLGEGKLERGRVTSAANVAIYSRAIAQQAQEIRELERAAIDLGPGRERADAVDRLSAQRTNLANLRAERDRLKQVADTYDAETGRRAAASITPPPVTPDAPKNARALAAAMNDVNERLRLYNILSAAGLNDKDQAPDGFREQISAVEELQRKVRSLGDDIRTLGARTPDAVRGMFADVQGQLAVVEQNALETARRLREAFSAGLPVNLSLAQPTRGAFATYDLGATEGTGVLDQSGLQIQAASLSDALAQLGVPFTRLQLVSFALEGAFRSFTGAITQAGAEQLRAVGSQALSMAAVFTPAGAAAALFGSVLEGAAPLLEALKEPLRVVGTILGSALAPILKAIFPVFKLVAIAATYVGEIFFRVSGWITEAVGQLVRMIGRAIDFINGPLGGDAGLGKAGQAIVDLGKAYGESADALKTGRDEIRNLEWEDALANATDATNRFSSALINAVDGFKVERYRFDATRGAQAVAAGSAEASRSGTTAAPSYTFTGNIDGSVTIMAAPGDDGEELYRKWKEAVDRKATANPAMRPWAASLAPA